ncbi:MAG: glycosyltransferase, partial [Myxococcota bacterium]
MSLGTRGDIQPFLALANGLSARGHRVTVAAPDNFESWVRGHGVDFVPLGIDMESFIRSAEIQEVLNGSWLTLRKIWRTKIVPMVEHALDAAWTAAHSAEVLVHHPKVLGAPDIAEANGAKLFVATPIPMHPTGEFPLIVSGGHYGPTLNRLSWSVFNASRLPYRRVINSWRRDTLGLGPGRAWAPVGYTPSGVAEQLCAVSSAVLPRPADWPPHVHLTGYWFLDEGHGWEPDESLTDFLSAGDPPIYIGFGSMPLKDPEATT